MPQCPSWFSRHCIQARTSPCHASAQVYFFSGDTFCFKLFHDMPHQYGSINLIMRTFVTMENFTCMFLPAIHIFHMFHQFVPVGKIRLFLVVHPAFQIPPDHSMKRPDMLTFEETGGKSLERSPATSIFSSVVDPDIPPDSSATKPHHKPIGKRPGLAPEAPKRFRTVTRLPRRLRGGRKLSQGYHRVH